jgi:23S rRNA pseudouridine1911/1915/1917 synthase
MGSWRQRSAVGFGLSALGFGLWALAFRWHLGFAILRFERARSFVADRGDARLRLDQVIVRRLADVPGISRTRVQRWIDERDVLVNNLPARRAAAAVAVGDRVSVHAPDALVARARPSPESGAVDVLYEDDDLLAINKPPGVVVHPSYKHSSGTLFNRLLGYLQARPGRDRQKAREGLHLREGENERDALRLLQRLDKDTSGVLLASRTHRVHVAMQRVLASPSSRKEYLAIVHGRPRPRSRRSTAGDPPR